MMRPSPRTLLIAMIVVIATALIVKTIRYTSPTEGAAQSFDTDLTALLAHHGWQRENPDPAKEKRSIDLRTFRKQGCSNPIHISVLGTTTGLESYLRQTYGDDLAFVQQGAVRTHPSQLRLQLAKAAVTAKNIFSPTLRDVAPIFAVIPAPKQQAMRCSGPPSAAWATFAR